MWFLFFDFWDFDAGVLEFNVKLKASPAEIKKIITKVQLGQALVLN